MFYPSDMSREIDFSELLLWNLDREKREKICFHIPGHNRGVFFDSEFRNRIIGLDTTELSNSENLHRPGRALSSLMEKLSEDYGSGCSVLLTTGSTTGIHIMIASVTSKKGFFLLPRSVHQSVLSVFTMLNCRYAFIDLPGEDPDFAYPQLDPESLQSALNRYPQTTDVFLVSPDYFGRSADLRNLSEVCRKNGCRLLVDEAHGAHFSYGEGMFPRSAMASGADISVQSLHKTMPALTMTSLLHIGKEAMREGRVSRADIFRKMSMFETSSPSLMLAASAEYAVAWMRENGRISFDRLYSVIVDFVRRIEMFMGEQDFMHTELQEKDFTRLVLDTGEWRVFAPLIQRELEKRGVFPEFAEFTKLVFILSPRQREEDLCILHDALVSIYRNIDEIRKEDGGFPFSKDLWKHCFRHIPRRSMEPHEVSFGDHPKEYRPVESAEGYVAAEPIVPCPPGIPILWPGEIIEKDHTIFLSGMLRGGMDIYGVEQGCVFVFRDGVTRTYSSAAVRE